MARRTSKRRRRRTWLAVLVLMISAALIAAYLWRALQPHPPPAFREVPSRVQQPSTPANGGEDFTAAERQGLQDALKGRGAGRQR
jgi:apolipoprotein N-acyltransferase